MDVVLRDGSTLHLRPVRRDDEAAVRHLLGSLRLDPVAFRFVAPDGNVAEAVRDALRVDYADRFGLVALADGPSAVVAHALYARTGPDAAAVAFAVAEPWQGRGVATLLLVHLAQAAARNGIELLTARVRPENHRMLAVFRDSGLPLQRSSGPGEIRLELPTALDEAARRRFAERDRLSAVAAVRRFLAPSSVALVGASDAPGTVGARLLENLRASYSGPLHVVNRHGGTVAGLTARRSVLDVPGPVELAVVAVPATAVVAVARDCGRKGVASLLVISSGFELGAGAAGLREELLEVCRMRGMRLVGPNSLGLLSTEPGAELNATFARARPLRGRVALVSQSGGVGAAALELGRALGLGLSSFASIGDRADISSNDLLEFWEDDEGTGVVLMYLESFGRARNFARIARRVGRRKPVLAVKGGRSRAGARAAASHTGALVASSDSSVDALFRQAGIVRADTLGELLDVARLLSSRELPGGRRIGVITNAGGPAIMCVDACAAGGLEVPELPAALQERLRSFLPEAAAVRNPVDLLGDASPELYARAVAALAAGHAVDALVAIYVPALSEASAEVAEALVEATRGVRLPVACVFLNEGGPPAALAEARPPLPAFAFPEDAVRALARVASYADWRRRPASPPAVVEPPPRGDEAAAVVAAALARGEGWLAPEDVASLAGCYGIPLLETRVAASPEEAVAEAAELGLPVALKARSATLVHKSDAGGVRLDLRDDSAVREAAARIARDVRAAGHELEGLLVQRMAGAGVELLLGVAHDPVFGPLVVCAAGGVATELMRDAAVRLVPLSEADVRSMPRELAAFPLLEGFRGTPAADVEAVEDVLRRVGALAEAHPEVAELDLNPVLASPAGAVAVDMRVRLEAAPARPPGPSLQGDWP